MDNNTINYWLSVWVNLSKYFDPDKIAIPDFGTGAMENWGLITYRETNLLYDENQSSSYNKQRVASVIAHELVHQVLLSTCRTQFFITVYCDA